MTKHLVRIYFCKSKSIHDWPKEQSLCISSETYFSWKISNPCIQLQEEGMSYLHYSSGEKPLQAEVDARVLLRWIWISSFAVGERQQHFPLPVNLPPLLPHKSIAFQKITLNWHLCLTGFFFLFSPQYENIVTAIRVFHHLQGWLSTSEPASGSERGAVEIKKAGKEAGVGLPFFPPRDIAIAAYVEQPEKHFTWRQHSRKRLIFVWNQWFVFTESGLIPEKHFLNHLPVSSAVWV